MPSDAPAAPTLAQDAAAFQRERATSEARKRAARMAKEQLEFRAGKRRRAWEGDYLNRILEAAMSDRDGCLTCVGRGRVWGWPPDPHLPAAPEMCPDCDPRAPGFAPMASTETTGA